MKLNYFLGFCFFALMFSCSGDEDAQIQEIDDNELEIKAVDASYLPKLEALGTVFYNSQNQAQDAVEIFKNNGINYIRLRLWHSPQDGVSGFEEVKQFAQRIHNQGLGVWLTVHYSDSWADPGQQTKPALWQNLNINLLNDSVYRYTRKIVREIQPEIIQIGNEINNGFLFPEGNRWENSANFNELILSGINAVSDENPTTEIMLHYAGPIGVREFFDSFAQADYDYAGISFYPVWHTTDLNFLGSQINILRQNSGRKVVIAETAYPFTLEWNDNTNNIIGLENQLLTNYPATMNGQKNYLESMTEMLRNSGAKGLCYWGAEWVSTEEFGSSWENQALFDFNNKAVPAMRIFND